MVVVEEEEEEEQYSEPLMMTMSTTIIMQRQTYEVYIWIKFKYLQAIAEAFNGTMLMSDAMLHRGNDKERIEKKLLEAKLMINAIQ